VNRPLIALAGLIVAGGTAGGAFLIASPGGEEEVLQQVETATPSGEASVTPTPMSPSPTVSPSLAPGRTPGPGETLYRWVNLEVIIPDGSGISAGPGAVDYPGKRLHFLIGKVDPEDSRISSTVVLDSETGAIVEEQVLDQHREEIDRVLATLSVSRFDRTTAPWPYNDEPTPDLVRQTDGGLSYIKPSPASGLYMGFGLADPGGYFIDIRNERSTAFIQFRPEGPVFDTSSVHEEDKPAFDRWLAAIKRCGTEIEC